MRRRATVRIAAGRIESVEEGAGVSPDEARRVVVPGFVNAHAHLDLGALAGEVPAGALFTEWVGALLAKRETVGLEALAAGARASADALVRTGTTTVCDIDSLDVATQALAEHPLRIVSHAEIIDGSPATPDERTRAALDRIGQVRTDARDGRAFGLSPHAPHTVGDDALAAVGDARRRGRVDSLTTHWAETLDEVRWLADGTGPFAGWLGETPRTSGLERLARAGVLDGALLAHGNHPAEGDAHRVARAGAAVVHCPGCHEFFGRAPFPWSKYREAGAPVVLGTDSAASNDALDMRREMRIAMRTLGIDAREALRMSTEEPARFLPWGHVTGRLDAGSVADFVVLEAPSNARLDEAEDADVFRAVVDSETRVVSVRVGGVTVDPFTAS